jgi:threonine/homoserine/homoserine lactone efflux protein
MSLELWLGFALASAIAVAIPGPVVIFVLGRAASGGWRTAMPTVAGVVLGDAVAMSLSLLGLGAVLAASALAFSLLKWVGAGYLIWLGVRLWRAEVAMPGELPAGRAFRDAFIVTVLNPKSIGFFVAFIPQFLVADAAYGPQALVMLVSFVAIGGMNVMAYAALAARLREEVRRPVVRAWFNRAGGTALIGAGLATAALRRA